MLFLALFLLSLSSVLFAQPYGVSSGNRRDENILDNIVTGVEEIAKVGLNESDNTINDVIYPIYGIQEDIYTRPNKIQRENRSRSKRTTGHCQSGWSEFRSQCYQFTGKEVKWNTARSRCASHSAELASITSSSEQHFVQHFAARFSNDGWWIGGYRNKQGNFRWTDGNSFGYTLWDNGEPSDSDGEENCVEMITSWDGKWNDSKCHRERGYICKKGTN